MSTTAPTDWDHLATNGVERRFLAAYDSIAEAAPRDGVITAILVRIAGIVDDQYCVEAVEDEAAAERRGYEKAIADLSEMLERSRALGSHSDTIALSYTVEDLSVAKRDGYELVIRLLRDAEAGIAGDGVTAWAVNEIADRLERVKEAILDA